MLPDNMTPNDGEWFAAPDVLEVEKQQERNALRQAKPLVQDVIKRFDKQIAFYDSIESVNVSIVDEPAVYQRVMETHKLIKEYLVSERKYIMDLLEAQK